MTSVITQPTVSHSGDLSSPDWSALKMLVVKVTHRCNLKCAYCYEHITGGPDMSLDTFRRLVDVTLSKTKSPRLGFLFHGGEPTLVKTEWYRSAMDYAEEQAALRSLRCDFSMQSNFNYVPDDLLQLLLERRVMVGVSIDGPSHLNDLSRGGSHRVVENFRAAKAAGLRVGVLTTINSVNWNAMPNIIEWLQTDLGVHSFKANVAYPVGVGLNLEPLHSEQIITARKAILDHMLTTSGRGVVDTNLLEEVFRFHSHSEAASRPHSLCDDLTCGAGSSVLGVTPSGDLLPCGRFEWNDKEWKLGNIWAKDITVGLSPKTKLKRFMTIAQQNWAECADCRAKDVCTYGCQAFIVRTQQKRNIECEPTKWLFDYLSEHQQQVAELVEHFREQPRLDPEFVYSDTYYDAVPVYKDSYKDRGDEPQLAYSDTYYDAVPVYKDGYRDIHTQPSQNYSDTYYDAVPVYKDSYKDSGVRPTDQPEK